MVDSQTEASFSGLPSFAPIPSLSSSNQTLNLIFVTFSGTYTSPSDDLWLPANQMTQFNTSFKDNQFVESVYALNNPISVMACTEQHQFCNPNRGPDDVRCTPLLPLGVILDAWTDEDWGYFEPVFDTENQISTLQSVTYGAQQAQLSILTTSFDTPPLLADDLREGDVSLGLASDQWILEADNIFAMGLNAIQRWVTEFATGPPGSYAQYTAGGNYTSIGPSSVWLCDNQVVRDAGYTSFSTLWISLIFSLGGLVLLVSLNLETTVGYFQRRYRRGLYQQVRWQLDSTLQLQRMAFEEAGLGEWEGGASQVPTPVVKNVQFQVSNIYCFRKFRNI
jgi:hypothetical protein